jgi:histidine triad (HIT) family protein
MCIFCNIVKKEIPADIIYEDNDFIAFNDISPRAKIHIIVIPKIHVNSFEDFDSVNMTKMSDFIKKTTSIKKIKDSGYKLITNIGNDGGQEVMHLHFHILGGEKLHFNI